MKRKEWKKLTEAKIKKERKKWIARENDIYYVIKKERHHEWMKDWMNERHISDENKLYNMEEKNVFSIFSEDCGYFLYRWNFCRLSSVSSDSSVEKLQLFVFRVLGLAKQKIITLFHNGRQGITFWQKKKTRLSVCLSVSLSTWTSICEFYFNLKRTYATIFSCVWMKCRCFKWRGWKLKISVDNYMRNWLR